MGIFRKRPHLQPPPSGASPEAHLRFAREALAQTGTYEDEHGRRRKLTPEMRAELERGLDVKTDD